MEAEVYEWRRLRVGGRHLDADRRLIEPRQRKHDLQPVLLKRRDRRNTCNEHTHHDADMRTVSIKFINAGQTRHAGFMEMSSTNILAPKRHFENFRKCIDSVKQVAEQCTYFVMMLVIDSTDSCC